MENSYLIPCHLDIGNNSHMKYLIVVAHLDDEMQGVGADVYGFVCH